MRYLIIVLFYFFSTTASSQGLYWESVTTTTGKTPTTKNSRYYYLPGRIKLEAVEAKNAVIYQLDKQIIISLNHEKKTFGERTFADMDAKIQETRAMVDQKRKVMAEKLNEMPEADRKNTEEMLKKNMGDLYFDIPVEIIRTDSVKNISGFQCRKFIVRQDEKILQNLWTSSDIPGFSMMRKDFLTFSQRIASMGPVSGRSTAEALKDVEGFPIRAEIGGRSVTTVTKVEQRALTDAIFEIPPDYKKEEPKKKK